MWKNAFGGIILEVYDEYLHCNVAFISSALVATDQQTMDDAIGKAKQVSLTFLDLLKLIKFSELVPITHALCNMDRTNV